MKELKVRVLCDYKWNKDPNNPYRWYTSMRELSGFGGGYEEACRMGVTKTMQKFANVEGFNPLREGMKYKVTDEHNVTSEIVAEKDNTDYRKLHDYICKVVDGCSGAQFGAMVSHFFYARKHGWDKYVEEMEVQE